MAGGKETSLVVWLIVNLQYVTYVLRSIETRSQMARRSKTGFDKFLDKQMESPSFAGAYRESRSKINVVDEIVRSLDDARLALGMSKAALARAISARPEIVRRLFTTSNPNPTLETVVSLAQALGYDLQLVRHVALGTKSPRKATKSTQHRPLRAAAP